MTSAEQGPAIVTQDLTKRFGELEAVVGVDLALPSRNGAQRAREALDAGIAIEDIYRDAVAETRRTYAGADQAAKPA